MLKEKNFIAASILSADLAYLADDCKAMLQAGVNGLHIDVMDNHYVPNLTFSWQVVDALKKANVDTFYDVHLMVEKPEAYIDHFVKAGADCITFHASTTADPKGLLQTIKDKGVKAGLAFNPDEAIDMSDEMLSLCDMVLIMSVFPGFGGQAFMPKVLEKVPSLKQRCQQLDIKPMIAIDGGINLQTIKSAQDAGVDYFVMGSGLFKAENYQERVAEYHALLESP